MTIRIFFFMSILVCLTLISPKSHGQDMPDIAYFGLEPDIVTNYVGNSARKLGYVRLTVELMLEEAEYMGVIEHHAPLLRSATIEIFGRQSEESVKSITGREEIRRLCLEKIRELLKKETGAELVKDVIFTKYLYQG